jgi:hypothetical protein
MPPKTSKKKLKIPNTGAASNIIPGFGAAPSPPPTRNVSFFKHPIQYIHDHILYLNSSKFFAGVIMILLNVGSKFISIQFSRSTEEYLKLSVSKQILVFAMAWMGTRDIYTALALTAIFVVLSDHLFNEESSLCVVPKKYRILDKLSDTNDDGKVTDTEINSAIAILERAKKDIQSRQNTQTNINQKTMPNQEAIKKQNS